MLCVPSADGVVTGTSGGFAEGLSRRSCSSRGDTVFWRASQTGEGCFLSMSDGSLSAFPLSARGTRQW